MRDAERAYQEALSIRRLLAKTDPGLYAPDVAMTIRASIDLANGHKIQSDFSDIRVTSEGGDWPGPKSFTAEGKLNGGGPTLKVRTTTGDIKFLRASR